ncbi:MAG: cell division protein FtsZ [Candidatus Nealsonbacteria bacterium CG_4_10_14_0_8_um_filter_37_14]|uniref:Cell division protein FtsZ n=1 Tax=Candidatus Nealsonbacteria bacterium CG_4_10_14_0_8_um_filter_37_14 TaxID=1974684 RepID=A0A2M7R773_9BACT|nr:MAG: cell division protein FtsZ [Candidatus Nealsonbacteria bacterium CG11_big_fil_rev_8_21_14_0_20_37_68]PIW92314.1 MAG: cell division protein FtsZ [Candidatus Nealsonbacteria bacterium CG_4_8_14_3_um_filter_37_23]PIY89266.1 MAG: cell division protein FtsZ [Candidatus Nealsonbacteria bacterium CG_4_10_14_0_8_um_filter_37_14]
MTKIKVIGVGGSGSNTVSRMTSCKIQGVDLIAVNTDLQDLKKTKANLKIQIGKNLTKGLGAGMNPEIGKKAVEEQSKNIEEVLRGTDMVFITGGFGGGTCTGAAPVIAEIAKSLGVLTVAIVTKPFGFEGVPRMKIAKEGLENLKSKVDTLVVIPNDKLLSLVDENTTLLSAFWLADDVLRQAVQGISDLILVPGIINIDFADVKTILENSGRATFGYGKAKGSKRMAEAVNLAINSPLVDFSIRGAKGVLFNVYGGDDLSLTEIDEAAKIITKNIEPQAKVIFGAVKDSKLKKGEVKIMVIATGFLTST